MNEGRTYNDVEILSMDSPTVLTIKLEGVPHKAYYSLNRFPVLNKHFKYSLKLNQLDNGNYVVNKYEGMYPTDAPLFSIVPSNCVDVIKAYKEVSKSPSFGELELYAAFWNQRLELLKYITDDDCYVARIPTSRMLKIYNIVVNGKPFNYTTVGSDFFMYFKLRRFNYLSKELTEHDKVLIKLSGEAEKGNLCLYEGNEYPKSIKKELKKFSFECHYILNEMPFPSDKFKLNNAYDYSANIKVNKKDREIYVFDGFRVHIDTLFEIPIKERYDVYCFDINRVGKEMHKPFNVSSMRFNYHMEGQINLKNLNVEYIRTLYELFSLSNFVVVYKFHNNHLKRMFYGEMVSKLQLPEKTTWRGSIRNMETLKRLSGKVIKCVDSIGVFKESCFYKVEFFLTRVYLINCNDGARHDIDLTYVSKCHFLFDPFIPLDDFNYRRVRQCQLVVNTGVNINLFQSLYTDIKKLKLTK